MILYLKSSYSTSTIGVPGTACHYNTNAWLRQDNRKHWTFALKNHCICWYCHSRFQTGFWKWRFSCEACCFAYLSTLNSIECCLSKMTLELNLARISWFAETKLYFCSLSVISLNRKSISPILLKKTVDVVLGYSSKGRFVMIPLSNSKKLEFLKF